LGSFLTCTKICNFFQPNPTRTRDELGWFAGYNTFWRL